MAQDAQSDESTPLDDLPPEVIDALPEEIVEQLRDGSIDKIPRETVEQLRPDVADKVPASLTESAAANPGLAVILVLIGLAAVAGAIYGAIKGFLKVAVILGLVAAVAWYFFLNG